MNIKVEVKNDILGDCVFWQGSEEKVKEIRNIPARRLAVLVAEDGVARKTGMWYVSVCE